MLKLPDVTLVCVTNIAPELHRMAAEECKRHVQFGDVIEIYDLQKDYKRFFHYEMYKQLKTSHILSIQWDSWVTHPSAWTDEFLQYDYIGAPWGWYNDNYNVGNSGFTLMSRNLMEFIATHEDEFPIRHPHDHTLCREYQKKLPQFKWAPSELAWKFAFERTTMYPLDQVFGFHGIFNFPFIMGVEGIRKRLELAAKEPYITDKPEWAPTMAWMKERNLDEACPAGI